MSPIEHVKRLAERRLVMESAVHERVIEHLKGELYRLNGTCPTQGCATWAGHARDCANLIGYAGNRTS